MAQPRYQLVLTTCPDAKTARRLARALVSERLAACVNIVPIEQSVYRWKGRIESARERLLVVKSERRAYAAIERAVRALHPYELPEIIAVPIVAGFGPYLAWISRPDKISAESS